MTVLPRSAGWRGWKRRAGSLSITATLRTSRLLQHCQAWSGWPQSFTVTRYTPLREGQSWLLDAPNFGMAFGARHLTVLIELPVDYGIRPEMYRQFLRYADGDQRQVFTQRLRCNRARSHAAMDARRGGLLWLYSGELH